MGSYKSVAALLLLSLALAAGRELRQVKDAKATPGKTESAAKILSAGDKAALAAVAKGLTSQPVVFIALIRLKAGADADKFIATRESVAAKAIKNYPGVSVAYIKGAAPAKTETLPQGAAKLDYFPVAAIMTAPDAKTYAEYNAAIAHDADYVASGKDVEAVVRTTNLQL